MKKCWITYIKKSKNPLLKVSEHCYLPPSLRGWEEVPGWSPVILVLKLVRKLMSSSKLSALTVLLGLCLQIENKKGPKLLQAWSTYIPRVLLCMSLRWHWASPTSSPASECASPLGIKGGGEAHSPAGEGVGKPNSNDWRKGCSLFYWISTEYIFRRMG